MISTAWVVIWVGNMLCYLLGSDTNKRRATTKKSSKYVLWSKMMISHPKSNIIKISSNSFSRKHLGFTLNDKLFIIFDEWYEFIKHVSYWILLLHSVKSCSILRSYCLFTLDSFSLIIDFYCFLLTIVCGQFCFWSINQPSQINIKNILWHQTNQLVNILVFVYLQVRNPISAKFAAKHLARAPIWLHTLGSIQDINHSLVNYATKRSNVKSTFAVTKKHNMLILYQWFVESNK